MNFMPKNFALSLVLLGCLGISACGGVDPNKSTTPAAVPTCKIKDNWTKVYYGLTIQNVINILGKPNSQSVSTGNLVYTYETCRVFVVRTAEDDATTPTVNEAKYVAKLIPGTVTFNGPLNGYVVSVQSPKTIDEAFVYEFSDEEVIASFSAEWGAIP
jgi:hypothetical protein